MNLSRTQKTNTRIRGEIKEGTGVEKTEKVSMSGWNPEGRQSGGKAVQEGSSNKG